MASKLKLVIVTPEKVVVEEKGIEIVVVKTPKNEEEEPTINETGIMSDHAPMLARIAVAELRYTKDNKVHYIAVAGGFVEVNNNVVTVLSSGAEQIEEMEGMDSALFAKQRAEEWLYKQRVGKVDFDEKSAEADIKKASIDLYRSRK